MAEQKLKYYIIYKPFGMLSQFTREGDHATLAELYNFERDVYPVGRLDTDSEGLLLLTNDKRINSLLLDPARGHGRTYLAQVEGLCTEEAVRKLREGVEISLDGKKYRTLPAEAALVKEPSWIPERQPPIRFRKNIPTSWITVTLKEGKNRQVRRMTAAAGFPTLRLVRIGIGKLKLEGMFPGDVREVNRKDIL